MEIIIFLLFFVFAASIVFSYTIPISKKYKKTTGGIINHDSTMRKFVYKINLSNKDIIDLLKTKNISDELSCSFDFDKSVIRLSEYGSHRDYYFQVEEYDNFSVLKLEQVAFIGMKSSVPYKLNPFMVSKLQAEIVPFSDYGF